jgi:hypothetical protein
MFYRSVGIHGLGTLIRRTAMTRLEQLELAAQRSHMTADVVRLVEKYRAIFEWDVPDIDLAYADRLILMTIRQALDELEKVTQPAP